MDPSLFLTFDGLQNDMNLTCRAEFWHQSVQETNVLLVVRNPTTETETTETETIETETTETETVLERIVIKTTEAGTTETETTVTETTEAGTTEAGTTETETVIKTTEAGTTEAGTTETGTTETETVIETTEAGTTEAETEATLTETTEAGITETGTTLTETTEPEASPTNETGVEKTVLEEFYDFLIRWNYMFISLGGINLLLITIYCVYRPKTSRYLGFPFLTSFHLLLMWMLPWSKLL